LTRRDSRTGPPLQPSLPPGCRRLILQSCNRPVPALLCDPE
jgi:hypothetical protein